MYRMASRKPSSDSVSGLVSRMSQLAGSEEEPGAGRNCSLTGQRVGRRDHVLLRVRSTVPGIRVTEG